MVQVACLNNMQTYCRDGCLQTMISGVWRATAHTESFICVWLTLSRSCEYAADKNKIFSSCYVTFAHLVNLRPLYG